MSRRIAYWYFIRWGLSTTWKQLWHPSFDILHEVSKWYTAWTDHDQGAYLWIECDTCLPCYQRLQRWILCNEAWEKHCGTNSCDQCLSQVWYQFLTWLFTRCQGHSMSNMSVLSNSEKLMSCKVLTIFSMSWPDSILTVSVSERSCIDYAYGYRSLVLRNDFGPSSRTWCCCHSLHRL